MNTLSPIDKFHQQNLEKYLPAYVTMELTYRCNLSCRHCYLTSRKKDELTFDEIKNIIDQTAEAGGFFFCLTGGEIFLRKDFFKIAFYARDKNLALRLLTNGTLIDKKTAGKIKELGPLDVGISIYGAEAETHDYMTQVPGSFSKSLEALRLLNEAGIKTKLKCLVMKKNAGEITQIQKLAEKLGAIANFDLTVTPQNNGNRNPVEFSVEEKDLIKVYSSQKNIQKFIKEKIASTEKAKLSLCHAGKDLYSISPEGDVFPCIQWPFTLGNLRRQSLKQILNSKEANWIRQLTLVDIPGCFNCKMIEYCRICPGLNMIEKGDYAKSSNISCREAAARLKSLEIKAKKSIELEKECF